MWNGCSFYVCQIKNPVNACFVTHGNSNLFLFRLFLFVFRTYFLFYKSIDQPKLHIISDKASSAKLLPHTYFHVQFVFDFTIWSLLGR